MANPELRWKLESEYADAHASFNDLDPVALARYRTQRRSWFPPEFRFAVLGDLQGKHVLDVGCGDGLDSALLCGLGAEKLTGIDISPRSIEAARSRAARNDMPAEFHCEPLEHVEFSTGTFDIIWCNAILHHMLDSLPELTQKMRMWLKPGGVWMAVEPVNFFAPLRRLRLALPIPVDATPDERPLTQADVAIIRKAFPTLRMRPFGLTTRFTKRILPRKNYERSPWPVRSIFTASSVFDYAVLSAVPSIAGSVVMWARG